MLHIPRTLSKLEQLDLIRDALAEWIRDLFDQDAYELLTRNDRYQILCEHCGPLACAYEILQGDISILISGGFHFQTPTGLTAFAPYTDWEEEMGVCDHCMDWIPHE